MKKYIDKSALVAEIEDWRDKIMKGIFSIPLSGSDRAYATFEYEILGKVRDFIDTLEVKDVNEEPVSNDLEREIKHYVYDPYFDLNGVAVKGATDYLTVEDVADIARHFVQWQKEQLMENAVEAVIHPYDGEIWVNKDLLSIYDDCQRVKLIIIKEDKL